MTETTTTTEKRRIPRWVWSVATTGVVFGILQVPKIYQALVAGIEGGEHVCQMIYEGKSVKTAFESMEGDKRFNYPKRYRSVARTALKGELSTYPPLKRYFDAES